MEWIDVEKELPIDPADVINYATREVIVCDDRGEVFVSIFAVGNTIKPWHNWLDWRDGKIIYWMPLPSPTRVAHK